MLSVSRLLTGLVFVIKFFSSTHLLLKLILNIDLIYGYRKLIVDFKINICKLLWIAVGADADDDKIELLLSEVKGKDITELIASGREKLASVPSGGGGGGGVAVAAAAPGAGGAIAPAAERK